MKLSAQERWLRGHKFELDNLRTLTNNLFIENKNLASGYYYKEYPLSSDFVRYYLKETVTLVIDRLEAIQGYITSDFETENIPLPTLLTDSVKKVKEILELKMLNNPHYTWDETSGYFSLFTGTKSFYENVLKPNSTELMSAIEEMIPVCMRELKIMDEQSNQSTGDFLKPTAGVKAKM